MINAFIFLEAIGLACGVVGAVFVSCPYDRQRAIGFGIWIIGDLAWLSVGVELADVFICLQFAFYLLTALFGLRSNLPDGFP